MTTSKLEKSNPILAGLAILISGVSLGADIGLSKIYNTGIVPAELNQLGWNNLADFTIGIVIVSIIWLFVHLFFTAKFHLNRRNTAIQTAFAFLPLTILLIRSLEERYFLSSATPAIRMVAWLGVIIALWCYLQKQTFVMNNRLFIGLIIFLISAAWAVGFFGIRRHPVGDEPSYLMITHSLAQDHDINMNDDYRDREYRRFYSGEYPMFTHLGFDGINYPHHSIGLPLLFTLPYSLILNFGTDVTLVHATRLFMAFIFALLAMLTYELTAHLIKNQKTALIMVTGCFLSGPLIFYSVEFYPEILTALLLTSVLKLLLFPGTISIYTRGFLMGILISYLPWLGIKYIPVSFLILIIACVVIGIENRRWKHVIPLLIPMALSVTAYLIFLYSHYHNLNPSIIYTGVRPGTGIPNAIPGESGFFNSFLPHFKHIGWYFWGMLIEQRIGLLILSPIYLLFIPGLIHGLRTNMKAMWILLSIIGIHLFVYSWHNNWGGYCPPNRQIIAVAPLIVCISAWGWETVSGRFGNFFKQGSLIWGWGLAWIFLRNERWLYHTMNPHLSGGEANLLNAFSVSFGSDLSKMFPLIMGSVHNTTANIVWSVMFCICLILLFRSFNKTESQQIWTPKNLTMYLGIFLALSLVFHCFSLPPECYTVDVNNMPYQQMTILDNNLDNTQVWIESEGFWLEGKSSIRIIFGFDSPDMNLNFDLYSLAPNLIEIDFGGNNRKVIMDGKNHAQFSIDPHRAFRRGNKYFVKARFYNSNGSIPKSETDNRFLGVFIRSM